MVWCGRKALVPITIGLWLCGIAGCGGDASTPRFEQPSGSGGVDGAGGHTTTSSSSTTGGNAPQALGPPYPVVLAHGFFGFDDFAGAGFLDYYYGVRAHLASRGETLVFTPDVDPFNSSEVRGAQLAAKIQAIVAETGHAKVNIIGHSQGGLDARVVAHDHPELVASVISLQTPHGGTPIADIALELVGDPNLAAILDFLTQAVGAPLYDEVGEQTSLSLALYQFSEPGMAAFDAAYPDVPSIHYASIAGRSDYHPGGSGCDAPLAPPWISGFDGELDPIDPLFDLSETILDGGLTNPYPNDGLVRVADAKHGIFLGCLPADHLDMIGQLLGDAPGLFNEWDYAQFYVDLIGYIRDQGL